MKHQLTQQEAIVRNLDHAQLALAGNLLEPALDHVRAALKLDPDHAEARLLEARIRLRRHEPRLALTALDHQQSVSGIESGKPHTPEVAMLRATAFAAAGKLELAVTVMESLSNDFPDDTGVLRALAGMQIHDGRRGDAAETLGRIAKLEPDDRTCCRLRAELIENTHPAEALEALGSIDHTNRRQAAQLCKQTQRLAEADTHYDVLMETMQAEGSLDAETCRDAAEVAELMGENQKAVDRFTAISQADAVSPQEAGSAWSSMGRLHLNASRIGEAARSYRRATKLNPQDAGAWAGLVTCAHLAGRKHLVKKADRKLRNLVGRSERRKLLAELVPHATAAPGQAVPEAAAVHSPLQRMLNDAATVLARSTAKFPERADHHYHRAVCDVSRGELADASQWLDKAIHINPQYAAALELSSQLSRADGGDDGDELVNDFDQYEAA